MNGRDNRGRRKSFRNRNLERSDRGGHNREGKPRDDFRQRKNGEKAEVRSDSEENSLLTVSGDNAVSSLNCISCGLPIADPSSALSDRKTGEPVHFDCVMVELSKQEKLETGDVLSYIGGGRFGIVHFYEGKGENRNFVIKKIVEWEEKDKRAEWRDAIADRYTVT